MKKKSEINASKQTIYRSDIYQTIDLLERQLNLYRQSEMAGKNLYRIHQEFDALSRELSDLKSKIKDLTAED